jgi:hypothetical protein
MVSEAFRAASGLTVMTCWPLLPARSSPPIHSAVATEAFPFSVIAPPESVKDPEVDMRLLVFVAVLPRT